MPRFRFTIRRMMVAVAIVAVFQSWVQRRSAYFWERAFSSFPLGVQRHGRDASREDRPRTLKGRYHFEMSEKYDQAASYPWLPIATDPPEPE